MHPVGDAAAVKLSFKFTVSSDWIEEQLQETGVELPETWEVDFDLPEVPKVFRGPLLAAHRQYVHLPGLPDFYAPVDEPEPFLEAIGPWLATSTEQQQQEEMQSRALSAAEAQTVENFESERKTWISQHGSPRLKRAEARGYKVNRTYATERAAIEFPRFWVDTSAESEIRERTDPSTEALDLEQEVRAWMEVHNLDFEPRIVWLVEPSKDLDEHIDQGSWLFEQQEAILVSGFLDRYILLLPVDEDLHRPLESGSE